MNRMIATRSFDNGRELEHTPASVMGSIRIRRMALRQSSDRKQAASTSAVFSADIVEVALMNRFTLVE
jgi:hypothetical protein